MTDGPEYTRSQILRAATGQADGQCPTCGSYRIDGKPPMLHKCVSCGFESGPVVHTDECPGCQYVADRALLSDPETGRLLDRIVLGDDGA